MPPSGYSGTPLWKKLGYKSGFYAWTINAPAQYQELVQGLPEGVVFGKNDSVKMDLIHFFTKEEKELIEELPKLKEEIKADGMIWVSWPKKASKVPTDVTEDVIRQLALKIGLVDIKVCAVNTIWSGLKLVSPLKDRL